MWVLHILIFNIVLAILGPLHFYVNFRIKLEFLLERSLWGVDLDFFEAIYSFE